jgi:hypothetical protein
MEYKILDLNKPLYYLVAGCRQPVEIIDTKDCNIPGYPICFKTVIVSWPVVRFMNSYGEVFLQGSRVYNDVEIELEVGKHYKTINGSKVYIYYDKTKIPLADSSSAPFLGVVNNYNNVIAYKANGKTRLPLSHYDIVGEV